MSKRKYDMLCVKCQCKLTIKGRDADKRLDQCQLCFAFYCRPCFQEHHNEICIPVWINLRDFPDEPDEDRSA